MTKSKKMCSGCYDNFYNLNDQGCWSYDQAKIVERTFVGTWQEPPYKWEPIECLSCWHAIGKAMIKSNDPRTIGKL